jgi:arylsulfatase A-like enzyme
VLLAIATAALPACDFSRRASTEEGLPTKILLVTVDTTRADHVSAYGYSRQTTPSIDALASRGVRFANAYTVMPTTDPSHASMLTCEYPRTHGIVSNGARRTNPDGPSLGAWLSEHGYLTAVVTARVGLDPPLRRIRGFTDVDAPRLPVKHRTAAEVLEHATRWLDQRSGERWFLWVHFWEPHKPYDPTEPERSRFVSGVPKRPRYEDPIRFLARGQTVPKEIVDAATGLYDAEVWTADRAVGRLVEAATDAAPAGREPLMFVLGDHGESLADRPLETRVGFGHGTHINDEVVKVPWLVVWKDHLRSTLVKTPVSLVDLTPTLIDLVEPGARMDCEGRSLAEALRSGVEPPPVPIVIDRRRFASQPIPGLRHDELAWIEYPWKLIRNDGARRPLLYRLDEDPGETRNLADTEAEITARLTAAMAGWKAAHPLARDDEPITPEREAEHEALRSLGYID